MRGSSAWTATSTVEPAGAWRIALSSRLRITRPSAAALPVTHTPPGASSTTRMARSSAIGVEGLDRLVGDLGQVDRRGRHLVAAAVEPDEHEQVVDERRQRIDVALHGGEVALRVGRDAVGQRLDRGLERGDRRAQVVADAREHGGALVLEAGPFAFEAVQALGQLVEGVGHVAELVDAVDVGADVTVALLDAADGVLDAAHVAARAARWRRTSRPIARTAAMRSTQSTGAQLRSGRAP